MCDLVLQQVSEDECLHWALGRHLSIPVGYSMAEGPLLASFCQVLSAPAEGWGSISGDVGPGRELQLPAGRASKPTGRSVRTL